MNSNTKVYIFTCDAFTQYTVYLLFRRINYWTQFVEDHTVPETSLPHIFVVGSHFDKIQESGKVTCIEKHVRSRLESSPLKLDEYFPIDCR